METGQDRQVTIRIVEIRTQLEDLGDVMRVLRGQLHAEFDTTYVLGAGATSPDSSTSEGAEDQVVGSDKGDDVVDDLGVNDPDDNYSEPE